MTAWYPSLVVNLKLRFDESLHLQPEPALSTVEGEVNDPASGDAEAGEPLIVNRGEENTSFILNRVPRGGAIEMPGYRQAGQFEFTFDFRDLPIDPRTIRAAAIEIYLGAVNPDDFATGMTRVEPDGTRRSILRTRDDSGNTIEPLMVGFVDEWDVVHDESGSTISAKGRDARGILLDTPIGVAPGATQQLMEMLDLSQPIDAVVTQILLFNPFFSQFLVTTNPEEWPNSTIPSPGAPDLVPRHRRGARGQRAGGRATPPSDSNNLNFWDLIVRVCYLVGAIPYFEGLALRIRPSRSIYDQARQGFDPNVPTPFAGGRQRTFDQVAQADINPGLSFRRLVYGRDVRKFSFNRKLGGFQRPRVIRTVAIDSSSTERGAQRMIEARWPPATAEPATRRTRVAPSGQQSQEEILNIPVAGVVSQTRLEEIARSVYEEIGRGEMGGACETENLASFGGGNSDPDLLRMRPGDGVEFMVDTRNLGSRAPLVSALTDSQRTSFEEAVQEIASRIGDQNLARVIVATARGQVQELQRFFRVSTVKYAWSLQGIKIAFDFQNYVVVRNQVGDVSSAPGSVQDRIVPTRAGQQTVLSEIRIVGRPPEAS